MALPTPAQLDLPDDRQLCWDVDESGRPVDGPPPGRTSVERVQLGVTTLIVAVPFAGVVAAMVLLWGWGISGVDLALLVVFYLLTGFGITVGFHRLLTHRSFTAVPVLRAALAVLGSCAFEGGAISWVATHRRHHAFTDRPGDPHSPYRYGTGPVGQLRGLGHAHVGWLFGRGGATSAQQFAPDLLADPMLVAVDRMFPGLCVLSLGLPMLAGYLLTGTWHGALTALLWAGLVRIFLLHHVTWSVNSLCHLIGSRPFTTRRADRATNLWPLAIVSLGDSWHNLHHSDPTCARHGVDRGQVDLSAAVIAGLERCGWATDVRWPTTRRVDARRR